MRWSARPRAGRLQPGRLGEEIAPAPATPAVVFATSPPARPMLVLLGIIIVLGYGRLIEMVRIPWLLLGMSMALLTYGLVTNPQPAWARRTPSILLLLLTLWMVPSAVLGDWPTGSGAFLIQTWARVVIFYVLVVTLGRDLDSVRRIMAALAWATSAIVMLGLWQSQDINGRLGADVNSLSNPNDLAFFLIVGLPFCGWYAADSRRAPLLRLIMGGLLACGLFVLLLTGSRMGLVAFVFLALVLFLAAGRALKVIIVAAGLVLAACSGLFLPRVIEERYLTMVTNQVDNAEDPEEISRALGSSQGRWTVFVNSLEVTIRHPVLGVGPNNYTGANAELGREAGQRPVWQQSHNSYTQMSAECGIPGGLLFLALVVYCVRSSYRMWKAAGGAAATRPEGPMALCLFVASLGYATCAIFGSLAYSLHLQLLSGLVLALYQSLHPATAGFAWRGRSGAARR